MVGGRPMAIYYCPKCNKRYFLDDKEQSSQEFQREFKCEFCGTGFDDKQGSVNKSNNKPISENTESNNIEDTNVSQTTQTNNVPNTSAEWDLLLKIERKQLETLQDIKSMIKFFFILTIIGLVLSIIIPFL